MPRKTFLWCPDCNELLGASHPCGNSAGNASGGGFDNTAGTDALEDFRTFHARHKLETLHGLGEGYALSAPPSNLARVEYLQVTDGRNWFVVRSAWVHLAGPVSFNLIPGCLPAFAAGERSSNLP